MLFDKLGEEKKQSALYTLCFVLEQSLKLLHPICFFEREVLARTFTPIGKEKIAKHRLHAFQ